MDPAPPVGGSAVHEVPCDAEEEDRLLMLKMDLQMEESGDLAVRVWRAGLRFQWLDVNGQYTTLEAILG
jgi:hypothetical protein